MDRCEKIWIFFLAQIIFLNSNQSLATRKWICKGKLSKLTDFDCQIKGHLPEFMDGCYIDMENYFSCGNKCNGVVIDSFDGDICKSLCNGFLNHSCVEESPDSKTSISIDLTTPSYPHTSNEHTAHPSSLSSSTSMKLPAEATQLSEAITSSTTYKSAPPKTTSSSKENLANILGPVFGGMLVLVLCLLMLECYRHSISKCIFCLTEVSDCLLYRLMKYIIRKFQNSPNANVQDENQENGRIAPPVQENALQPYFSTRAVMCSEGNCAANNEDYIQRGEQDTSRAHEPNVIRVP